MSRPGPEKARRARREAVTMCDVARSAGVSPMTVSRVINGDAHVQETSRQRVQAAVKALGYMPNIAARGLAGARTMRIGLVYHNPSAAYLSALLVGCLNGACERGMQLVVELGEFGPESEAAIEKLVRTGVDAIILPPPLSDSPALIARLRELALPFAALAASTPPPGVSSFRIDDRAAAAAMTRHLLQLGHRRIAFIRGARDQTASAAREEGYRDALYEAGVAVEDGLIAEGNFSYASGMEAARVLLAAPSRPTAIFASNDDMAMAAIAEAHRRGLIVPDDLSVVGFDNTALATAVWPPLTTVSQPITEIAAAAVRHLADHAGRDCKHAVVDRVFPSPLVVRESAAAPPRS